MTDDIKPMKKIIDVAHPGESAPSTNSKSVIISKRPVIQDPMMSETSGDKVEEAAKPETTASPVAAKKVNIQPLSAQAPSSTDTGPTASSEQSASELETPDSVAKQKIIQPLSTPELTSAEKPTDIPKAVSEPEKPVIVETTQKTESSIPDQTVEEKITLQGDKGALSPELQQDLVDQAAAKEQKELEKLIDSKQFYLPIDTIEKRRTKQTVAIGIVVSIILMAAWVDIALDAGLVSIDGLQPLTNIF